MPGNSSRRQVSQSLREGLRVSRASFAWTIVAGACAITIGVLDNSLVLVAFGLIGLLDGVGSGTLIAHFRHSQRNALVSERHERLALIVVTGGMWAVGIATVADSVYRLSTRATSDPQPLGIALAGVSVVVLAMLATRKQKIAKRIPSRALHADGWLSAVGAGLALLALSGTGLDAAFGWWWVDAAAATSLGWGAIALSIALARGADLR